MDPSAPDVDLRLEWVYGYNCQGAPVSSNSKNRTPCVLPARTPTGYANLVYNSKGHLVYTVRANFYAVFYYYYYYYYYHHC